MDIKEASKLVIEAKQAVSCVKQYQDKENNIKGQKILEQMSKYIYEKLEENEWIFYGATNYAHIIINMYGIVYVDGSPVMRVKKDETVMYCVTEETLLYLVKNWKSFKKEFGKALVESIKKEQEKVSKDLSHTLYVKEQLDTFEL